MYRLKLLDCLRVKFGVYGLYVNCLNFKKKDKIVELKSIKIINYRSIKEIDLDINEVAGKKCMILLGINESGKSNILKAINSKDGANSIEYDRDFIQQDDNDKENKEYICVTYTYINGLVWTNIFKDKGIPESLAKIIKIIKIERDVLIKDGSEVNNFWIYIEDNKEFSKYTLINNKIQLITDEHQEAEEAENLLDKKKLEEYLESDIFYDVFEHNIHKIIFWKAEDKYLINNKIDLNEFKENTNISIPLRNCFNIAEIEKDYINNNINNIIGNSAKKSKLQKKLSEKVTQYINTVWTEHKIKISFDIDNMQLSFLIEEQDSSDIVIDVNQRSDGFKQFISILLNLSIENETGTLKDKIILLDEPEIHLHPSGQKYLRDELLKIAENNIVIYATHSPYMVDKKNLDRHYHVKKTNGLTTIKKIERNNPFGDEILYKALGASVLEHIEPNVLIVEGKTDRDIFNLYCENFKELEIPNISVISADGATSITKYAKFLNTKLIKGFILVDSDKAGKKAKKDVLATGDRYTDENTFEINDFYDNQKANTLEDLFDKKHLENAVKSIIKITLNSNTPFIAQIKKAKKDIDEKIIKNDFMQEVLNLNKKELERQKYFNFFKKLIEKIST
jgi:predicted ATP-dependent endonuclease of OLD family